MLTERPVETMIRPGDSFGEYAVVRLLGKGGMGEVWLLRSPSGAEVAAKILNPTTSADHASRARFLREAELALGVRHPNLVETYDVGEDPETGLCYILMEYAPNGTLAAYLEENGPLSVADAVSVVRAMADVLELGRQKGIVHRDIKPSNIMFDAEGTPKLADLGIARSGAAGDDATTVTRTGMMIGTPAYMAPEQMLDAHHVDTRADIYSLGVVFFEMLTGERPNKDDTVVQLMAKAVKGEPLPDVRTLRPDVPPPIARLIGTMVVADRQARISTPAEVSRALDAIASGRSSGEARFPVSVWLARLQAPRVRKILMPVGGAALGLAAAYVVPDLRRGSSRPSATVPLAETVVVTGRLVRPVPNEPPLPSARRLHSVRSNETVRVTPSEPVAPEPERSAPAEIPPPASIPPSAEMPPPTNMPPAVRKTPEAKPLKIIRVAESGTDVAEALKQTRLVRFALTDGMTIDQALLGLPTQLRRRVNFFVLCRPSVPYVRTTVNKENITAQEALDCVCCAAGCRSCVVDNVVCIAPADHDWRWKPASASAWQRELQAKLARVRIDVTLSPSMDARAACARFQSCTELEPETFKVVWVVGETESDPAPTVPKMALRKVSVWTALELFCNASGWDFSCLRNEVVKIHPRFVEPDWPTESRFSQEEKWNMTDGNEWQAMRKSVEKLFPGWRLCGQQRAAPRKLRAEPELDVDALPGYVDSCAGRRDVLRTYRTGSLLEYDCEEPLTPGRKLVFWTNAKPNASFKVWGDNLKMTESRSVAGRLGWRYHEYDLAPFAGKRPVLSVGVDPQNARRVVLWHGLEVR